MKDALVVKDEPLVGRDEMNLAEFPITLLSDKSSKSVKTLTFEDQYGKLTVSGSDDYGLPTAPDGDVIVGLIQLTKMRNNFKDRRVMFSRYELLKLLGWDDQGRHYRRLDESLRRWVGVTLRYDKCWYDNSIKCRVDANFHIIDSVTLYDQEVRQTLRSRQQQLPLSSFSWGDVFFKSCTDDNIKRLDLTTYLSLRSAVSKRMYRFLDKRFYVRGEWTFDLRELAFEHVGLSRNYTAAKIKEKLQPALEELEGIGFLRAMTRDARYTNVGRGEWRVRLAHNPVVVIEAKPAEPVGLVHELTARGVTEATAREVVKNFPEERVRSQIERVDFLRAKKPKKIADQAAYLVAAIRDDYAPPAGFESNADRARREAADREQRRQEQERRQQEAKAKALDREAEEKVRQFWDGLGPDDQARIEAEAIEDADAETKASITTGPKVTQRIILRAIRDAYIRRLLGLRPEG
ncbi:hypothetical protein HK102_001743 [Quaeritorhiza haematococci]|nr:hypothetical protein HK102_001743 [Quaeritorhiza haematococci]